MTNSVDGDATDNLPELYLTPDGGGITFEKVETSHNSTTGLKGEMSNLMQRINALLNSPSPFEEFFAREAAEKKKSSEKEAAMKAIAQAKITPAKAIAMKNSEVTTNAAKDAWALEKSAPPEEKLAARINARLLTKVARKNHSGRYCNKPYCLNTLTYAAQQYDCVDCRKCRPYIISRWVDYHHTDSEDELERWDKFCAQET
jgi:hypothetical protein